MVHNPKVRLGAGGADAGDRKRDAQRVTLGPGVLSFGDGDLSGDVDVDATPGDIPISSSKTRLLSEHTFCYRLS
jgi:hypothetical protein